MTKAVNLDAGLKQVSSYTDRTEYLNALELVEKLLKTHENDARLLVWKGKLIQLTDGRKYELADAERSFRSAIRLEPV